MCPGIYKDIYSLDVIVCVSEGLYLGELGLVRECGQHHPQLLQRLVEGLHPRPLTVIRLRSADLLHLGLDV